MCYRCMESYDGLKSVCPNCGYDGSTPHNPMYIAPGTILHERYIIGVLLGFNGEGATYIAYDKVIGCKVLIREYMPITLCTRVKNKPTISVNYNNLAKYKAFMAEYTELNKTLARFRNNTNIIPTVDMFAENNTTYTVCEYVEGIKLLDYLKDNAGELSWSQVSEMFPPLFTTIGIIHNAGIIHRAISPETIYVTEKGELKLSGFCVSAVRTVNAGLEYELFKGYAAPEQYSASTSSRQGSWTDVYGVCALLYRVLTGCMPTDAPSRLQDDSLCEPYAINRNVPPHVSRVIMEGLNLSGRDRIQTITELVTKLFEQPEEIRPVYATSAIRRDEIESQYNQQQFEQPYNNEPEDDFDYNQDDYDDNDYDEDDYQYEKVSTIDRFKVPIIIGVLLLAILMIIIFPILKILSPDDEETSSYSSSVPDNVIEGSTEATTEFLDGTMPNLDHLYFETTQKKYSEKFTLEAVEEYNNDYDKGQIFEQDIAPGTPFKVGDAIVKVKVSKGPSSASIPDYKNCTVAQYENMLSEAGIPYQLVEDTSGSGNANTITHIDLNGQKANAGDTVKIASGEKLIVYFVVKNAVVTTTAPPQTEAPTVQTTVTTVPPQTEPPAPTEAPQTEPPQQQTEPPQPEQPGNQESEGQSNEENGGV